MCEYAVLWCVEQGYQNHTLSVECFQTASLNFQAYLALQDP